MTTNITRRQIALFLCSLSLAVLAAWLIYRHHTQGPPLAPVGEPPGERVLQFPRRYSFGQFRMRDWRPARPDPPSISAGWPVSEFADEIGSRDLRDARGKVVVPPGKEVLLTATRRSPPRLRSKVRELLAKIGFKLKQNGPEIMDLSPLRRLAPGGIDHLRLHMSVLDSNAFASVARLKSLRSFVLHYCRFDNSCAAYLKDLPRLEEMFLDNAPITEVGFAHFLAIRSLKTLVLSKTPARVAVTAPFGGASSPEIPMPRDATVNDSDVPSFAGPSSLRLLSLSKAGITDRWLAHLEGLTALEVLELQETTITGKGLRHIGSLENLKELEIRGAPVGDEGLAHIGRLKALRKLALERVNVTDEGLAYLRNLNALESLSLASARVTDVGAAHLADLTALRHLRLWHARVGDEGLGYLKNLRRLETLSLDYNPVSSAGLAHLVDLPALRTIHLGQTQVDDEGLVHLGKIRSLEFIALNGTSVTDEGLKHLYRLDALRLLAVRNTAVTDEGVQAIKQALPRLNVNK